MSADERDGTPALPAVPHPQPADQPDLPEHHPQHHGRGHAARTEDPMSTSAPAPETLTTEPLRTDPLTDPATDPVDSDPVTTGATAAAPAPRPPELTGPAVGTLAWGLVALAVAGVLVVREVTDLTVDLSYALPVGMVALGLLLVVGAVVTGVRRR